MNAKVYYYYCAVVAMKHADYLLFEADPWVCARARARECGSVCVQSVREFAHFSRA